MRRLIVVLSLCIVPWWAAGCVTPGTVREEVVSGTVRAEDGDTAAEALGEVHVETVPAAMVSFGAVPVDGRSMGSADFQVVNIGDASVTLEAVEVSTTQPASADHVFITENEATGEPLPIPRVLQPGEGFPLTLLFVPDAVATYQGRLLARFDGDAVVERVLVGSGCEPADCPS